MHRIAPLSAARLVCCSLLLLPLAACRAPLSGQPTAAPGDYAAAFDEVWQTVRDHFFDPGLRGLDWAAVKEQYAPRAAQAASMRAFAEVVNAMLDELQTSHTAFYTPLDPAYHQLLSIFAAGPLGDEIRALYPDGAVSYPGIGIFTEEVDGQTFVSGVLEGGPAHAAGLLAGDRIEGVAGAPFEPIASFEGRVGQDVTITVQRTAGAAPMDLTVRPAQLEPEAALLTAMEQSIRLIEAGGRRVGYVHAWSYAGEAFHELLQGEVAFGALKDADALVLDLRGGWGGASPTYLNLFNPRVPALTQVGRDGQANTFDFQWRKPVALLVDGGSRSGKEVLAYGFKKYGLGPVGGAKTAGAVVGGRPFLIRGGMLLYLAVADTRVDGERLEGRGIVPDVEVPFSLPYAEGRDPQLDAAVRLLADG
jgi:carboxyl-terminal processing protease